MNESERLAHYTVDYFTRPRNKEIKTFLAGTLRSDQVAALAYAFAVPNFVPDPKARDLPIVPNQWRKQCDAILDRGTRCPNLVLDVGCGRGEMLVALTYMQVSCIGLDPTPGAAQLVPKTFKQWLGADSVGQRFHPQSFYAGMCSHWHLDVDTVLFVESVEHIPSREFDLAWPMVCSTLSRTGGRCVFTNWVGFWPIKPDTTGYDHVSLVNDDFYDRLAKDARSTIFREGSHLVLQF